MSGDDLATNTWEYAIKEFGVFVTLGLVCIILAIGNLMLIRSKVDREDAKRIAEAVVDRHVETGFHPEVIRMQSDIATIKADIRNIKDDIGDLKDDMK